MNSLSLALSWTLIHSLWIALAIWLFTGLVNRFVKTARTTRIIKVTGMSLFAFAMLGLFVYQLYPIQTIVAPTIGSVSEAQSIAGGLTEFTQQFDFSVSSWSHVIPQLWLIGLALGLLRWIFISRSLVRYRNSSLPCTNDGVQATFEQVRSRLSISRKVTVLISPLVNSPMTMGWLKPIIYLPTGCVTGFSTQELETIFTHELSHIKRHDYLVNLMLVTLETVFFFNPMVWLMARDLRKEMEFACDEQVLQYMDKLTYAQVLLRLQIAQVSPSVALAAKNGKSEFKQRMDRIVGTKATRQGHSYGLVSLILVCGFLLVSAFNLKNPETIPASTDVTINDIEVEKAHGQDTLTIQTSDSSEVIYLRWEKGQDTLYIEGATLILKSGERPREIKLKRKRLPKPGESLVLHIITTDAHKKADKMFEEIYDELVKDEIIGPHKAKVTLMFQYSDILNGEASLGKHYEKYKAIFNKHFPKYDSYATTRVFRYKPD